MMAGNLRWTTSRHTLQKPEVTSRADEPLASNGISVKADFTLPIDSLTLL